MGKRELNFENVPAYWFVRLERAIDESDLETAVECQRELRRLGVDVRYRLARRRPSHPECHNLEDRKDDNHD